MPQSPVTRNLILDAIKNLGPMSARELADFLGKSHRSVASAINAARYCKRQCLRVEQWRRPIGHGRTYAVYGLGSKPDARKPEVDKVAARKEATRKYTQKHKVARAAKQRLKRQGTPLPYNPFTQLYAATGTTIAASRMELKRERPQVPDGAGNGAV